MFTYAVGPTATPVAAIKWMACANRGECLLLCHLCLTSSPVAAIRWMTCANKGECDIMSPVSPPCLWLSSSEWSLLAEVSVCHCMSSVTSTPVAVVKWMVCASRGECLSLCIICHLHTCGCLALAGESVINVTCLTFTPLAAMKLTACTHRI